MTNKQNEEGLLLDDETKEFIRQEVQEQVHVQLSSFPYASSVIHKNTKKDTITIFVCFYNYTNPAGISTFGIKYYMRDDDTGENKAKETYRNLEVDINNPGLDWVPYNPAMTQGSTVKFGDFPARVYFAMFVEGWKFATKRQDAITSKLPVSNYYTDYNVVLDDKDPDKYIEHLFSIYNHNSFQVVAHEYNIHCLINVGKNSAGKDLWMPTNLDPKFENP